MFFHYLTFLLSAIVVNAAFCQSGNEWGARSAGMGNSSVALSDVYSGFNNIGGLGQQKETAVLLGLKNNFGVASFSGAYAGLNLPIKNKITTINFSRFGDNLYNEQTLGAGIAHQLNYISIGIKIDLLQQHIDEIITRRSLAVALGGIVKITDHITFGSYVWNVNQAKKQHSELFLPTILKAGFAYCKDNRLTISNEVYKSSDEHPDLRFGLEYFLIDWIAFRTGLNTKPFKICFGTGIRKKSFSFDYAFNNHYLLGNIHQFSMVYIFK